METVIKAYEGLCRMSSSSVEGMYNSSTERLNLVITHVYVPNVDSMVLVKTFAPDQWLYAIKMVAG